MKEQLSKINPYILIGTSISGTLLILHILKLWKRLKLSMSKKEKVIYSVDLLVGKSKDYLAQGDSAQASEKAFQGCKKALMEYVKEVEKQLEEGKKIIPENQSGNEWDYSKFGHLCEHLRKKIEENDEVLAEEFADGWKAGTYLHKYGWTQNDVSVEKAERELPKVYRFIQIVEELLPRDNKEWADYLYAQFHQPKKVDLNKLAATIVKQWNKGEVTQLLQEGFTNPERARELNSRCKRLTNGSGYAVMLTPAAINKYLQKNRIY